MRTAEQVQHKVGRSGGANRRLQAAARQLNDSIGMDFFQALVKHLAKALEADCVYVGEFVGSRGERVRTVAAAVDERQESFEFALAGTPEAQLAAGNPCAYSRGVQELFPSDSRLAKLGAEACAGYALRDTQGRLCGPVMAIYRRPLHEEVRFAQSMLATFAPRAVAELIRKHEEDALRESEQRYRAFIMLNTDGMWRLELDKPISVDLPDEEQLDEFLRHAYIAECNDAMARLQGRQSGEELIGTRVRDLRQLNPDDVRDFMRSWAASGYRFSTVEVTPTDPEGNETYRLRSQWGIVEDGMLHRVWGTTRDVSELKRYKMAFLDAERRLTELLEAVHLVAIVLDRDGTISFCNDYLLALTGWRADEVVGKNWFDLMAPPEEREALRAAFLSALSSLQSTVHREATLVARDGRRWLVEWDNVILRDSKGKMTGLAGIGRDVTEYKALETRLRQAQRLESIGRLAGGVAHDFNNLLTVIRGYSSLLLEHRKHTDSAYIGLVEIKRAAEKGAALTKQLLAFSRRKASEPQMIDLNAIIAEDERMLRRLIGDHIELNTNLDPALGLVRADPSDIHQSLLNLAVNSRDAMPEGGSLTLATSNIDVDEEHAFRRAGVEPGQYVRLVVADTGVGMSADVRAHLFEPFFTTKDVDKGTGLGLSTVYGIIQQAGGHILVQTEAGEGASFEIILPRAQPLAATLAVAAESSPSIRGGTETLLLVEDQRELRTLLGSLLERLGYTVLQAGNGRMALRLMKRVTGAIHLLVTDLMMPGMLGSELAQRVTAAHPETKVLYVSGYGDVPAARPLPGGAASEFLQKSFTPEQLAAKVREMLDR